MYREIFLCVFLLCCVLYVVLGCGDMFYVYFMPCIVLGAMYLSSVVFRGKCCVVTWIGVVHYGSVTMRVGGI